MKIKRIITMLLAVLMMLGTISSVLVINTSAEDIKGTLPPIRLKDENGKETEDIDYKETVNQYFTHEFATPQARIEAMEMKFQKDGFQLYVDNITGEVATVNIATGEILFTNPYDVANSNTKSDSVKQQIMSQIVIKYTDNDTEKYFYSCEQAAMNGQITVKNIKNGIRVEYKIGREETKMLVPRLISKIRFEEQIRDVAMLSLPNKENGDPHFLIRKLKSYYLLKDLSTTSTPREKTDLLAAFPITNKMPVYVFDPNASAKEKSEIEGLIKTYCPKYTYEELDKDHAETEYEGSDRAPALFKLALEYSLDNWGMTVRLPANGIRFNETEYQLTYISILPFMGAGGTNGNKGYNFFPDGSGTLFRFEELAGSSTTINGKVYGQDYAYQTIAARQQEIIRYPVYGIVENWAGKKTVDTDEIATPAKYDSVTGEMSEPAVYKQSIITTKEDRGFLAIIEEGDALAELSTYHMGTMSDYNTIQMLFYPRPKDSFNLQDAVSVADNATMTVVSSRKYVGNYKIRYIMLSDDKLAASKGVSDFYPTTWEGMAHAYQDYLVSIGDLERLTEDDIKEDIPLYIETFGALDTYEKIMSIPVSVMTPLTTFENIQTIYKELLEKDIDNVNFKLKGYYNGGMYSTVPYHLKWESAAGGSNGFEELVADSHEKDYGIFPDFDFSYSNNSGSFDGLSISKHAVKTIDNRYTIKRTYSSTIQGYIEFYVGYFEIALSPAYFERFITKLTDNYLEYNPSGISVSTLGSDLNSDFDEDEPYNREDSKQFVMDSLKQISSLRNNDGDSLSIMTDKGNAYTWKYVDHILNIPLDSSRYIKSSNSVPFIGVVLHGYIQFAGTPFNMEGDTGYALLKAIESGSGLYFILSYQNTEILKEDAYLSKYYSIRYDIWKSDLIKNYNELNDLLKDLQTKLIISHDFLVGERVPDADEIVSDEEAARIAEETKKAIDAATAAQKSLADALTARKEPAKQLIIAAAAAATAAEKAIVAAKAADKIISSDVLAATDAFDLRLATLTAKDTALSIAIAAGALSAQVTELAGLITSERIAYKAAIAAGVQVADLDNSIQLGIAYSRASSAETAAKTFLNAANTAWTKAISNVTTKGDTYYTGLKNLSKEGADTATSSVIDLVINYNMAEDKALDSEYLAALTGATQNQITDAATARTAADAAKALMLAADGATLTLANTAINNAKASIATNLPLVVDYYAKKAISDVSGSTAEQKAATAAAKASVDALEAKLRTATEGKYNSDAAIADRNAKEIAYNNAVTAYNVTLMAKTVANNAALADPITIPFNDAKIAADAAVDAAVTATVATLDQINSAVTKRANLVAKELAYQNALAVQAKAEAAADAAESTLNSPIGTTDAERTAAITARELANTAKAAAELAKTARDTAQVEVDALNLTAGLYLDAVLAKEEQNRLTTINTLITTAISTASAADTKYLLYTKANDEILLAATAKADFDSADAAFIAKTGALKTLVTAADTAIIVANVAAKTAKLAAEIARINADITKDLIENDPSINLPIEIIADTETLAQQADQFAIQAANSASLAKQGTEKLPFMQAKVLLFADQSSRDAITAIQKNVTDFEIDYNKVMPAVVLLRSLKIEASAAQIALKSAKADYEEALAKYLLPTSTAEEKSAAKVDMVGIYVRIITAQKTIDLYQTQLASTSSMPASLIKLENAHRALIANADIAITNVEYARTLLDALLADPATDPVMLSKAQAAYTNLKALADIAVSYADDVTARLEACRSGIEEVTPPVTEQTDTSTQEEYTVTKYTSDDGRIIKVTYGGKDGNDAAPYRSFILNYNAFKITTVVDGTLYTVDAFGYVVINH